MSPGFLMWELSELTVYKPDIRRSFQMPDITESTILDPEFTKWVHAVDDLLEKEANEKREAMAATTPGMSPQAGTTGAPAPAPQMTPQQIQKMMENDPVNKAKQALSTPDLQKDPDVKAAVQKLDVALKRRAAAAQQASVQQAQQQGSAGTAPSAGYTVPPQA